MTSKNRPRPTPWLLLLLAAPMAGGCADGGTDTGGKAPLTPVYVTFYSHNEENWGNFVTEDEAYADYRASLIERVNLLTDRGATLNWQTEALVVHAMAEREDPALFPDTGDLSILAYMSAQGVSLDPHTHTSNGADIVYEMQQLGGVTSSVAGGVKAFTCGGNDAHPVTPLDWTIMLSMASDGLIYGVDHDTSWRPEVLSGPAMGGHWFDEMSTGVWRPGVYEAFFDTDAAVGPIYVGQGSPHDQTLLGEAHPSGAPIVYSDAGYIQELVGKLRDGELPADQIYTASLHIYDAPVAVVGDQSIDVNEGVRTLLDTLQPYVDSGEVVYMTYQDVAARWEQDYGAEPVWQPLDSFSGYEELWSATERYCSR